MDHPTAQDGQHDGRVSATESEHHLTYVRAGLNAAQSLKALNGRKPRGHGNVPVFHCGLALTSTAQYRADVTLEPGLLYPAGIHVVAWKLSRPDALTASQLSRVPVRGQFTVVIGNPPEPAPAATAELADGTPTDPPAGMASQRLRALPPADLVVEARRVAAHGRMAEEHLVRRLNNLAVSSLMKRPNYQPSLYANSDIEQEARIRVIQAIRKFGAADRPDVSLVTKIVRDIHRDSTRITTKGTPLSSKLADGIQFVNAQEDLDPDDTPAIEYARRHLDDEVRRNARAKFTGGKTVVRPSNPQDEKKVETLTRYYDKIKDVRHHLNRPASIDQPIEGPEGVTFAGDGIADPDDQYADVENALMEGIDAIAAVWFAGAGLDGDLDGAKAWIDVLQRTGGKPSPDDVNGHPARDAIHHALNPLREHGEQWDTKSHVRRIVDRFQGVVTTLAGHPRAEDDIRTQWRLALDDTATHSRDDLLTDLFGTATTS